MRDQAQKLLEQLFVISQGYRPEEKKPSKKAGQPFYEPHPLCREIKRICAKEGISRAEFCKRYDISPIAMSRWMNGRHKIGKLWIAILEKRMMDKLSELYLAKRYRYPRGVSLNAPEYVREMAFKKQVKKKA